jgi:hypothetical protein
VQNLDPKDKRVVLRHHRAATLDDDTQKVRASISQLVDQHGMQPLQLNVLGKPLP